MAGYDPKRPRPVADGDEPAPVDALLDPVPDDVDAGDQVPDAPDPEAANLSAVGPEDGGLLDRPQAESEPTEPGSAESESAEFEPESAGSEPVASEVDAIAEPVGVTDRVEAVGSVGAADGAERHLRSVPSSDSTVPIAERPAEPTTNRAVIFVSVGAAAVAALLLVLLLRRRRR